MLGRMLQALQAIAHQRFAPDLKDRGMVRQRSRGKLTCRARIDPAARRWDLFQGCTSRIRGPRTRMDVSLASRPPNHVEDGAKSRAHSRSVRRHFTSRGGHADGPTREGHSPGSACRLICAVVIRCWTVHRRRQHRADGAATAEAGESSARKSSGTITPVARVSPARAARSCRATRSTMYPSAQPYHSPWSQ